MTTTITLIIIAALLVLALIAINRYKKAPMAPNHDKILVLTNDNFKTQIQNKLVLVDFWAEWCMPCKMMAPILNDLAAELPENKFVAKVDIEAFPQLAQQYGIRNIPTLVLFENGKEVERYVGVKQKGYLKEQLSKY